MKKTLVVLLFIMLPLISAIEFLADPSYIFETDTEYILDIDGKMLILDKASLSDKNVIITNEGVEIGDVSIEQLSQKETFVYFGKPEETILKSNKSIVYLVEHYWPDLSIDDSKREEGWKRFTAVIKDAEVEVRNGIIVRTDGLKINKESFFENSEDKEIDYIKEDRLFEMYTQLEDMIMRSFHSFRFNDLLDRGYTGIGEIFEPEIIETEDYYDVIDGVAVE